MTVIYNMCIKIQYYPREFKHTIVVRSSLASDAAAVRSCRQQELYTILKKTFKNALARSWHRQIWRRPFDRVWHEALVAKLYDFQVPLWLVRVVQFFLSDRSFRVRVGDSLSERKRLGAGVPQGSALSPLLYSLYADDVAIYAASFHSQTTVTKVQGFLSVRHCHT